MNIRCTTLIFVVVAIEIFCINLAHAVTSQSDFLSCLKRTKNDRANCQLGCGIILQSCYNEAIAAIDAKIGIVRASLSRGANPVCANLAEKYIQNASRLKKQAVDEAEAEPGWLSAELSLRFAEQQLDTVDLIKSRCTGHIGN